MQNKYQICFRFVIASSYIYEQLLNKSLVIIIIKYMKTRQGSPVDGTPSLCKIHHYAQ